MSKKSKAEKATKKIAKLEAFIADKSNAKPDRKAAKRELQALVEAPAYAALGAALGGAPLVTPGDAEPDPLATGPGDAIPAPEADEPTPEQVIAAADKVLKAPGSSEGAIEKARAARKRAKAAIKARDVAAAEAAKPAEPEPVDDGAIAAKVHAKRALRKAGLLVETGGGRASVDPDTVPRDNAELVAAYNLVIGTTTGHYITSDDERAAIDERVKAPVASAALDEPAGEVTLTKDMSRDGVSVGDIVDGQRVVAPPRKALAVSPSKAKRKAEPDEVVVEIDGEALAAPRVIAEHEAVEVETETGREFAVGEKVATAPAADHDLAQPSEAPPSLETNGLGQYKILDPAKGKLVGYTRVTTYIDNLEDKSNLDKWRRRILLEGLAINETAVGTHDGDDEPLPRHLLAELRDAIHARDVAIAKAHKASRKGKLATGELGELLDDAAKTYRDVANRIAEDALALGGEKDKAQHGTDLHALCELYDLEGIDAVAAKLEADEITRADFDDVEAYARALDECGIKIVREHVEQVVVDDERKIAGRLDRIVLMRLPGAQRATRMIGDIKTGRVDYGAAKIAQQLEAYASADAYDLVTHERTKHGASRTKAVLIHLPAGKAECHVYIVDLVAGRRGNRLSGEVRAWRREGKKAIDFKADIADPSVRTALEAVAAAETSES